MKRILLVLIVLIAVTLLGGCCCCPTCPQQNPQQEWSPQIVGEIGYCEILPLMREITPCAEYRWPAKELYQLSNLTDTQIVVNNIDLIEDTISSFHSQPGCSELPFGYIEYLNGNQDYITAVIENNKIEFYKIIGPNGYLGKMNPDCYITDIVLY